ncbi:MAG: MopE-related protein [Acidobacteria bacterium]|jgi:nitrous oxidase accessory protein NosD|nr:MopE-related protein [Acidobacteriota bacterium]
MRRTARRAALALGSLLTLVQAAPAAPPLPARNSVSAPRLAVPGRSRPAPQPAGLRPSGSDSPGLEWCDGIDNDGDGSVDEERGIRFVAPGGSDDDNLCLDPGIPCATIGRGIRAACDAETVQVAAGLFVEDLVIDRPLSLMRWGPPPNPELRGTGSGDVIAIRSSRVTVGGIEVSGAPGHACVRIGDPAHPDVRHARIENMGISGCAFGVVADSTGTPADTDTQNRVLSVHVYGMRADGRPGSGSGVLGVNGTGRLLVIGNLIDGNDGAAVRVLEPPEGKGNDWILVVGNQLRGNGRAAGADSHAAVEVDRATRVRVEGNWIQGQVGDGSGSPGDGAVFRDATGGEFACNRVEDNGTGVRLAGTTSGIQIVSNRFTAHAIAAVAVGSATGSGSSSRENLFSGNAVAVDNGSGATFDARHCWWGGASGPGSASDGVRGPVDVSDFIARGVAPRLVRRPVSSGWGPAVAACYDLLQDAIAAAEPGDLVLVGAGTYYGHFALDKRVDLEGVEAPNACSPSVLDGRQAGGSHLPALELSGVSGVRVARLTIRNAGVGTPCGANQGDEVGLSLRDVGLSVFSDLCLGGNGVSELRLSGESDGNRLARIAIDGVLRDEFGQDACGHRSRDGVLLAGRSACEGGTAALAESNALEDLTIVGVARGVALRLARGTTIDRAVVAPQRSPAWFGGSWAAGVHLDTAETTALADLEIDATAASEGIRVAGRAAGDCATELQDAAGTRIERAIVTRAQGPGVHLHRAVGDPGAPTGTVLSCVDLEANAIGLEVDLVARPGGPANRIESSDLAGNGQGLRNNDSEPIAATGNWWAAASGPGGAGPGSGDAAVGAVLFGPFLRSSAFDDDDGDGYSDCDGDADDTDARVRPGPDTCDGFDNDLDGTIDEDRTPESCDGLDNDCNGLVDDVAPPDGSGRMTLAREAGLVRIAWDAVAGAGAYDLLGGDLAALAATHGSFAAAVSGCLADDTAVLDATDTVSGPSRFYLLRGVACARGGTWDGSPGPGQAGPRDPGIAAAPARCP